MSRIKLIRWDSFHKTHKVHIKCINHVKMPYLTELKMTLLVYSGF
jgi:hypothetical protein